MQLIFLNSLERKTGEDRVAGAQISITERQGTWSVQWNEGGPDGKPLQDSWYEGPHWKEMMAAYREGLRKKRSEGYLPLIDAVPDSQAAGRNRDVLLLQFYGAKHRREEIFQKLRQWRREQASKEGKSAFFIATNRMLDMLSVFLPHSADELRMVPGFGQRKTEVYGDAILSITAAYARTTDFPLHWVEGEVAEDEFEAWLLEQRRAREQQELDKLALRRGMLEGIANGLTLSALEQQLNLKRQEAVRLVEELDKEGYDVEALVESELAGTSEADTGRIQELFRKVGDRFLKPVLQGLFTEDQLKEQDVNRLYELLRLQRIRFRRLSKDTAATAGGEETSEAAAAV